MKKVTSLNEQPKYGNKLLNMLHTARLSTPLVMIHRARILSNVSLENDATRCCLWFSLLLFITL